jgi:AraC family transcriptional regulator
MTPGPEVPMVRKRLPSPSISSPRTARVGGFTLTEGVHPNGTALPWHTHNGPTMCFVIQGSFTEISGGTSIACRPSTFKVTPAGERHCDRFDQGDVHGLMIEVDPTRVESVRPYSRLLGQRVSFQGGLLAAIAGRVYQEFRRMDEAAPLAIEGLLLELLAAGSRQSAQSDSGAAHPTWLRDVIDLLHSETPSRLTLSQLAAAVQVHPVTLARAFRRAHACSVGEYVRRLRIERAAEELSGTTRSIAEIAMTAGFADQSHFSNVFRRHTGMSPSAFRRSVRLR